MQVLRGAGRDPSVNWPVSGDFDDSTALLHTCQRMNLESIIVSKRRQSASRSGPTRDWLKVKTATWRAENRGRWELYKKRR